MRNLSYNELVEEIVHAPMTFLPGLLVVVVKVAIGKRVFQDGGAVRLVERVCQNCKPAPEDWSKKTHVVPLRQSGDNVPI